MNNDQWVMQIKEWLSMLDEQKITTDDIRKIILGFQKNFDDQQKLFDLLQPLANLPSGGNGFGC